MARWSMSRRRAMRPCRPGSLPGSSRPSTDDALSVPLAEWGSPMPRALSGVAPAPDTGDLLLVAAGDDAAIQRLLDRWRQPLYSLFERMREPSAAVDAAAEVLAELFRTADRYDPDVPFPVWIWGIAARHAQKAPAVPMTGIAQQRLRDSASARTALLRSSVA